MHGLVALFLEMIALAIILLVAGLVAFCVLVLALRAIVASIISMTMSDCRLSRLRWSLQW